MRVAILDLGTNTFNLLIAEEFENRIHRLVNSKISVKLGKGGMEKGIIQPAAIKRAINAIAEHYKTIENYSVNKVLAFGTSALRTSGNAEQFLQTIKEKFGLDISIISGDEEAQFIFKGVLLTVKDIKNDFLILDIGGGSNEFILANGNNILWKQSFPIGMARVIEKFHISGKVKETEIAELESYFEEGLKSLWQVLQSKKITTLVGAEGAFESFLSMLRQHLGAPIKNEENDFSHKINIRQFKEVYALLNTSTKKGRNDIKGLEPFRMEMIVPAVIFVNFIIKKLGIQELYVSPYSLKEGAAFEVMRNGMR